MSSSPLADLSPAAPWRAFADLCTIPHPSRHEAAIIAFLRDRAAARGLSAKIDDMGNLIVRKPATPGREDRPGVILQAHVDMVPQANAGTAHDFAVDPIRPCIVDGWVTATGTTLGADNGIGAAAMLALIEDTSIAHGPLEFLFTVEEEIGLNGARAVPSDALRGTILLNLDSEDDDRITIGCAGGRDVSVAMPLSRAATTAGSHALMVSVRGLKGGHSGIDIHKGHGNAIRALTRVLRAASLAAPSSRLSTIAGGTARNAIPREASAVIAVAKTEDKDARAAIAAAASDITAELRLADPGLTVSVESATPPTAVFADALPLLRAINACPDGIARLSDTLPGAPETSGNVGTIATEDDGIHIVYMVRSSVNSARDAAAARIADVFALIGGDSQLGTPYPGWRPDPKARILSLLSRVHAACTGTPAKLDTIHAGLECAILGATYPHWEMASIGPNIRHPHSPDERVEIASVGRFWSLLTATLEAV